jgi:hypothetical protein
MANPIAPPIDQYRGTNIVEKDNDSVAWEVADFLFGAKSVKKIMDGEGTWGDALNVGITAATFLIPPAKIAQLGTKALRKVWAETIVVNAATDSLPVVARAASKTRLEIEAELARRGKLTPTERVEELSSPRLPMSQKRFEDITGREPEAGFVPEKPPLDTFGKDLIEDASPYTAKETATRRYAAKKEKEEQFKSTVEVKRAPKKPLTKEEEAIVKKVDEEIPEEIPKAEGQGKTPVINRKTGELEFESPVSERTALPSNISVSPRVDRSAWLQNQMDKLTRRKNSLPKEERAAVQAKIDKYDVEFKALSKKMNEQERAASGKLREELDKLDRAKSTKTAPKTKKFNVEEGKAELARLREEWSKTPVQDFEKRNQLKQQGKTLADRIKKMEGK